MNKSTQFDWTSILGRAPVAVNDILASAAVQGQCVLITGAGGSIGSGLALAALVGRPRSLLLLDSSEGALYESFRRITSAPELAGTEVIPIVGSIADRHLLHHIFMKYPVDLVLHAAAYKHVPLMEANPFSAIANNSLGTYKLVTAAMEARVSSFVLLSTDKAVNPRSIMGASKRIAEQVVLSHAIEQNRFNIVRLGNVLGSVGSVAPVFMEQIQQGRPLTVTHPDVSRYFLTQSEAEVSILSAATSVQTAEIFVPHCGDPIRIVELAKFLGGAKAEITFIGLRQGDKLHEALIGNEEKVSARMFRGMRVVNSPRASLATIKNAMKMLEGAIDTFNYSELLAAVQGLVPTYQPLAAEVADPLAPGNR